MHGGDATVDWTDEAAWAGTRRSIMSARALPAAAYTDETFHAGERDRVFAAAWVCIGFASEARPGRLLVRSVAGRSLLVTRTDDGLVHAFHNSCRHRGTELAAADEDVRSTIRCPYHRWCYALDGRLVRTPLFDEAGIDDFDPADNGLIEVRAATWGGLLFVCLDAATPGIDEWFGDLSERLASHRLDTWTVHDEQRVDIDANWKLVVENFSEYYHLPFVHPDLVKISRVEDHYRFQGRGMYVAMTTTPVSSDERDDWTTLPPAAGLGAADAASGRFIALFPNVLLSVLPNHAFVIILDPTTTARTTERCAWLLPPTGGEPAPDAFARTRAFWIDVNNEDIDIVERAQRGLTHGSYRPGRLSPRFEEPLLRFHNMVADHMTGTRRIPEGDPSDDLDILGSGVNPMPWSSRTDATSAAPPPQMQT